MQTTTGHLYRDLSEIDPEELERVRGTLAPLTETQFEKAKTMEPSKRKGYMRNQPCPCGSGKKFKRCHWDDVSKLTKLVES